MTAEVCRALARLIERAGVAGPFTVEVMDDGRVVLVGRDSRINLVVLAVDEPEPVVVVVEEEG